MHTSFLLLALLTPADAPRAADALAWQPGYTEALAAGREQGKPVAVFVGTGPTGWQKVSTDGLSAQARHLLADHYVCVYLDVNEPRGARLAKALEIDHGTGLVLSTKDGSGQALWHDGTLTAGELERGLRSYSNGAAVTRTEILGRAQVSYSLNLEDTASNAARSVTTPVRSLTTSPGMTLPARSVMTAPSMVVPYAMSGYANVPTYSGYGAPASYPTYARPMMYSGGYSRSSFGGGCPGGRCGR